MSDYVAFLLRRDADIDAPERVSSGAAASWVRSTMNGSSCAASSTRRDHERFHETEVDPLVLGGMSRP